MKRSQNFIVEMQLRPVPPDVYQELGRAEIEYTQEQMSSGVLAQLLVTKDHRKYWMVFAVSSDDELREVLEGFPLHRFFDYTVYPVMDMVEASEKGMTDPGLN